MALHKPAIIRIDPSFVVKDQITTLFQREVPDSQISVDTADSADTLSEADEDAVVLVNAEISRPEDGELEPAKGPAPAKPGLNRDKSWAIRPQRFSMDGPQPCLVEDELDFTPLPLSKVPVAATLEEMRPKAFMPLDGKKALIPVPRSKEDITAEWCTLAFRHKGLLPSAEAVTKVTMKPLGDGEGEFSELVLVTLEVEGGKAGAAPQLNRHLVAKFSPPDMSAVELAQVFGTEAHFYNDTSVEAGALVRPEALYVGYLKGGCCGQSYYCIIMESAAGTKDAPTVCFKRVDGCASAAHMRLVMRSLARFHARFWEAPQAGALKPYTDPDYAGGPLPHFPRCITHTGWVLMFKNGIKALPHCFSDHPRYKDTPKFAQEYARFIKEIRPIIRRRRHAVVRELFRKPHTLIHGDAHLENVFFGEQYEGGCTWIDFGLTMLGPGMADVSTIIAGGMPVEARREYDEMLVKEYHAALVEFGVSGYSWEQCWRDYAFQIIKPFFQLLIMAPSLAKQRKRKEGMFATPLSKGSQKLATMYVQLSTRIATALMDHQWKTRLEGLPITAGHLRPLA